MRVYGRILCFVNCHFAAHLEAVSRRNADFDHVYRTMVFTRPSNLLNTAGKISDLLLSCFLAYTMYLFWLFHCFYLPLVFPVAVGLSSAVQVLRSTNVCVL